MSTPESPDQIIDDDAVPPAEDVTPFASAEDDDPETHMGDAEVR
jgi:hypothetical protein